MMMVKGLKQSGEIRKIQSRVNSASLLHELSNVFSLMGTVIKNGTEGGGRDFKINCKSMLPNERKTTKQLFT